MYNNKVVGWCVERHKRSPGFGAPPHRVPNKWAPPGEHPRDMKQIFYITSIQLFSNLHYSYYFCCSDVLDHWNLRNCDDCVIRFLWRRLLSMNLNIIVGGSKDIYQEILTLLDPNILKYWSAWFGARNVRCWRGARGPRAGHSSGRSEPVKKHQI